VRVAAASWIQSRVNKCIKLGGDSLNKALFIIGDGILSQGLWGREDSRQGTAFQIDGGRLTSAERKEDLEFMDW